MVLSSCCHELLLKSEFLESRCERLSLRLSKGKSGLGHDAACTVKLDKNSIFTHVVVKLHGGLVGASVDPGSTSDSAGTSDLCRFLRSASDVLSDTLTDAAKLLDQVSLFDVFLDKCKLTEAELLTSKVNISSAISLSGEESVDLHALAEDDVVGGTVVLPESFTRGTTARGLLINNQGGFRLSSNSVKLLHEAITCSISALVRSGLDDDGGDRARLISLLRNCSSDVLKDLSFLGRRLRVGNRRPAKVQRHLGVSELSQRKRVAMVAVLEAERAKTLIGTSFAHSSKDGLLNLTIGASESHLREAAGSDGVELITGTISVVTINTAASVKVTVEDLEIVHLVAGQVLDEKIIVVTERQSFGAAEIEKNVAIDINNMAALRLLVFNKGVDLGGLLNTTHIVSSEHGLIPVAAKIDASSLSLDEGPTAEVVPEWSQLEGD